MSGAGAESTMVRRGPDPQDKGRGFEFDSQGGGQLLKESSVE